jgi:predicted XRE-type DNA-binding protein
MTVEIFDSVWDALEDTPADALNMKARSDFILAIRAQIATWRLTDAEVAERLGITKPRLDDLLHGRIDRFDLDALTNLARSAGLLVEWHISPRAA